MTIYQFVPENRETWKDFKKILFDKTLNGRINELIRIEVEKYKRSNPEIFEE